MRVPVLERLEFVVRQHGGKAVPCGLVLPASLSAQGLKDIARALIGVDRMTSWAWGDWWRSGEHQHGERMKLVNSDGWHGPAYQTLCNRATIAAAFQISRRREKLSFSHHAAAAALHADEADRILREAVAQRHPVEWVRDEVRRHTHGDTVPMTIQTIQPATPRSISVAIFPTIPRELAAQPVVWSVSAIDEVTNAVRDALSAQQLMPQAAMTAITTAIDRVLRTETIDVLLREKLERLRQALSWSGVPSDISPYGTENRPQTPWRSYPERGGAQPGLQGAPEGRGTGATHPLPPAGGPAEPNRSGGGMPWPSWSTCKPTMRHGWTLCRPACGIAPRPTPCGRSAISI